MHLQIQSTSRADGLDSSLARRHFSPSCMKCHNREKAATRLPFRDSVGTVGECAIEAPTTLFFIDLRRNLDTPKCHEKSGQL